MKAEKLLRSLFYMMASSGFVLVLSTGITLFLAKLLTAEELGILMAAEAFVELFKFFFNLGFQNSILKTSAKDPDGFEAGLNANVVNAILIKLCILVPTGFLIYWVSHATQTGERLLEIITLYIFIYSLESLSSIFGIARKALGQFKLMAIINSFNKVLRLAIIFSVLTYFGGLVLLVKCFLVEKIFRLIISSATTLHLLKPRFKPEYIKPMLKESFSYGILDSLEGVQGKINRVMLNSLIGPTAVANYSVPSKLNRATGLIPKTISQVFLPNLHDSAENNPEKFQRTTKNLSRFLAIAGGCVFIFIFYFAEMVLHKIFGNKFVDSLYIAKFFAYINLVWFIEKTPELILMSQAAHKKRAITKFTGITLVVILNIILIPKYGIEGAIYAMMAADFIRSTLYLSFTRSHIDLKNVLAIIVFPLALSHFLASYYLVPLFIIYLVLAKLIKIDDWKLVKKALKIK